MAKFELPIYGENDEHVKTYATDHIRWKLFIKAAEIQGSAKLNGDDTADKIEQIADLLKNVFSGITDEDLENADVVDNCNRTKSHFGTCGPRIGGAGAHFLYSG